MVRWLRQAAVRLFCCAQSKLLGDDTGASMVEYGLLVAAVFVVALGAVQYFFGAVASWFHWMANQVTTLSGGG
jgi:Flp pilus assembly pilin Flp